MLLTTSGAWRFLVAPHKQAAARPFGHQASAVTGAQARGRDGPRHFDNRIRRRLARDDRSDRQPPVLGQARPSPHTTHHIPPRRAHPTHTWARSKSVSVLIFSVLPHASWLGRSPRGDLGAARAFSLTCASEGDGARTRNLRIDRRICRGIRACIFGRKPYENHDKRTRPLLQVLGVYGYVFASFRTHGYVAVVTPSL